MEFAEHEGANWRKDLSNWLDNNLGHKAFDPVVNSKKLIKDEGAENYRIWKETNLNNYINFIRKCVDEDINIVRNHTDYLICLWDKNVLKGAGTHSEVTIAYDSKKPVYLINNLPKKDVFLGRQIFWDREKEEALILVKWKNKKLWKNIPMEEVNKIQKEFEDNVISSLNIDKNPFELIFEGELEKQK